MALSQLSRSPANALWDGVYSYVSPMHNSKIYQYNGYKVVAFAHRLPDGLFASNLLLERNSGHEKGSRYQFHVLDYFKDEAQAIGHSREWARDWVDSRG